MQSKTRHKGGRHAKIPDRHRANGRQLLGLFAGPSGLRGDEEGEGAMGSDLEVTAPAR